MGRGAAGTLGKSSSTTAMEVHAGFDAPQSPKAGQAPGTGALLRHMSRDLKDLASVRLSSKKSLDPGCACAESPTTLNALLSGSAAGSGLLQNLSHLGDAPHDSSLQKELRAGSRKPKDAMGHRSD
jgi:hypothetical protein